MTRTLSKMQEIKHQK